MDSVTFRMLEAADAGGFFALRLEALQTVPEAFGESAGDFRARSLDEVAAWIAPGPDRFFAGAFAGESLCGVAGFSRDGGARRRHKGTIRSVYVNSAWRGRGIARRLMEMLLDRARFVPGLEVVTLRVGTGQKAARRLYTSLGFQAYGVETDAIRVGQASYDEELREKILSS